MMKQYLLLRDNHQSGPHSFDEIRALQPRPLDLIWVEGFSTSWQFAPEVEELKPLVREPEKKEFPAARPVPATSIQIAPETSGSTRLAELQQEYSAFQSQIPDFEETHDRQELAEPGENQARPVWKRRFSLPAGNALNLAAVFASVLIGAFLIKKAVDDSVLRSEEIPSPTIIADEPAPDMNIHNALATEIVPVTVEKPVIKPKPRDIKKQVHLKANDYKVGLLGGINNLELTVVNDSPHFIDKVTVSVKYLKKNGDVIETEFFDLSSIRPRSSRLLPIPDKNRGMKVVYKIVNLASQEYKAALKQI